jgi:hypothetical protein
MRESRSATWVQQGWFVGGGGAGEGGQGQQLLSRTQGPGRLLPQPHHRVAMACGTDLEAIDAHPRASGAFEVEHHLLDRVAVAAVQPDPVLQHPLGHQGSGHRAGPGTRHEGSGPALRVH